MTWTWRRFWTAIGVATFLVAMGFGVRCAEDEQVGYTHDTSMWIFVVAGLFAYYAAIALYQLRRRSRAARSPKTPSAGCEQKV